MHSSVSNGRDTSGVVFEIERFSVNDGPGIRTLVFLKGCPLRCKWCANPESHAFEPQLIHWRSRCIGCHACIRACPHGALSMTPQGVAIDRNACVVCGTCCGVCNSRALLVAGERMTVSQVLDVVAKDKDFYAKSGGGVTFSGGEALAQPAFLLALMKACKEEGYHTCMETTGFAPWRNIEALPPYIDIFLYDIKAVDDEVHTACTGVSNKLILENFKRLSALKEVIVRFPVIPAYNDSEEDLDRMIAFLKEHHGGKRIDLLPYHRLGAGKYERLGIKYPLGDTLPPSAERMEELKMRFLDNGFAAEIGG